MFFITSTRHNLGLSTSRIPFGSFEDHSTQSETMATPGSVIQPAVLGNYNVITHPFAVKTIREIDTFNGDTKDLSTFIQEIEDILPFILKYDSDSQKIIMNKIKSKLIHKAREVIKIYIGETDTWNQIKEILYKHFGGLDSECRLYTKMIELKFKGNAYNFCYEIRAILSSLVQKFEQTNSLNLLKVYREKALETFAMGLPNDMRFVISNNTVQTMDQALETLTKYRYVEDKHTFNPMNEYHSKLEKGFNLKLNHPQNISFPPKQVQQSFNPRPFIQKQNFQPRPTFQNNNFQRNNNFQQRPFYSNPPNNNYPPKPSEPPRQSKQEPMDIDPRSSQVRRLYHNEQTDDYDNYDDGNNYYEDHDQTRYQEHAEDQAEQIENALPEETQNFHLDASEKQTDYHM